MGKGEDGALSAHMRLRHSLLAPRLTRLRANSQSAGPLSTVRTSVTSLRGRPPRDPGETTAGRRLWPPVLQKVVLQRISPLRASLALLRAVKARLRTRRSRQRVRVWIHSLTTPTIPIGSGSANYCSLSPPFLLPLPRPPARPAGLAAPWAMAAKMQIRVKEITNKTYGLSKLPVYFG